MSEAAVRTREKWVDDIKTIACILVVLGHFFASVQRYASGGVLYEWFHKTIYYFHVPLFFICSGYLYQKYSLVNDAKSYLKNISKKAIALGIPYITFSSATWILKTMFSRDVNNQIGGFCDTMFFHPTAPYWYLYALFLIFLITPTFSTTKMAVVGLVVAVVAKFFVLIGGGYRDICCINRTYKRNLVCAWNEYLYI
ncbi:MAG: acyltransferase [Eubacteriales bacterium]|nr:acyltransferase [Eubacteriales bacterium]